MSLDFSHPRQAGWDEILVVWAICSLVVGLWVVILRRVVQRQPIPPMDWSYIIFGLLAVVWWTVVFLGDILPAWLATRHRGRTSSEPQAPQA